MSKSLQIAFMLVVLLCGAAALASPCPSGQPKDENALLQQEQSWARALDQHDAQTVSCLLSDEFQDADVNGAVHERKEMLDRISRPRSGANRLENMHSHVYGDTGFVRGLNRVVDPSGKVLAVVRFTDLFVYRDGRWQAVAGQETFVTEK